MDILDVIQKAQGGAAVNQLGTQFGLQPAQAQSAISALLPAVAAGLQRNMTSEGGMAGVLAALAKGGHQRYLENPTSLADPATVEDGNGILGHVLGSKDVSRQVAQRASQSTGIDVGTLKKMLPLVAALAMGGLSRQARATSPGAPAAAGSGLLGMLTPLLDRGGDGSVIDDVLGMAGRFLGGRGQPT